MAQLGDPARLTALFETGVLDTMPEPAFDRLAKLASRMLGVSRVSVTLLDDSRQFTKAGVGHTEAGTSKPVGSAVCRFVVESERMFAVEDGRDDARVADHPAFRDAGIVSYLGIPLTMQNGQTLGALCVFGDEPHAWSPDEQVLLADLAASVTSELELRATLRKLQRQAMFGELLHAAAADANAAKSSTEALQSCMSRIGARLGWTLAHAYIVEHARGIAELASHGIWYEAVPGATPVFRAATEQARFAAGVALPGRVLASGEPAWNIDVARDESCPRREAAAASDLHGSFAMPVKLGSQTVAVIEMFTDRAEPPDAALLAVMADIGVQLGRVFERERAQQTLAALSLVDELTGLRNRRGFLELARHQLKVADRSGRTACLFFSDLNGMKQINDTLGHEAGDEAIRAMAHLLQQSFRDADVVARLGGDELVIFANDITLEQAATCRDRVRANVDAYNEVPDRPFRLSVSMGYALYDPRMPRSLEALLAEADQLMYEQKRARRIAGQSVMIPILRAGARVVRKSRDD